MRVGIVGHAADKFDHRTEREARMLILALLEPEDTVLVSGHCPIGGIDIWAEETADYLGREKIIHAPSVNNWSQGYKPRNILIARDCDVLHNILVATYPEGYSGMRFKQCYHCKTDTHVKSGGCWTALEARRRGKTVVWHTL